MSEYILVLTTVPHPKAGGRISRLLVEERLAACVTRTSAAESVYRWKGEICREREHVLFIKTRADLFPALEKRLREIHPYEVPEIIALSISSGSGPYLRWINAETRPLEKQKA